MWDGVFFHCVCVSCKLGFGLFWFVFFFFPQDPAFSENEKYFPWRTILGFMRENVMPIFFIRKKTYELVINRYDSC